MLEFIEQGQVLPLLLAGLAVTRLSAGLGVRAGLVDRPDARKKHSGAVPLTGGIAVFTTLLFAVLVLGIQPYTPNLLLIACGVFAVGIFDDLKGLSASFRLLLGFASGLLLATFGDIAITNVGNLLAMGAIPLLALTVPLTALAVAGLSNAYNMIDGIDGLAGATLALPLLVLYVLALPAGHPDSGMLLAMLVALGVFLLFNLGPRNRVLPRVFLGDAGSVTLGFLVTASLVYFSQHEQPLIRPVTALWLVTLPLMDMLATMLCRFRGGDKIMRADRRHLHYRLIDMGLGARWTLALLTTYAAGCALAGLALEAIPEYLSLLCYFLLFCLHCLLALNADAIGRRLKASATSG